MGKIGILIYFDSVNGYEKSVEEIYDFFGGSIKYLRTVIKSLYRGGLLQKIGKRGRFTTYSMTNQGHTYILDMYKTVANPNAFDHTILIKTDGSYLFDCFNCSSLSRNIEQARDHYLKHYEVLT